MIEYRTFNYGVSNVFGYNTPKITLSGYSNQDQHFAEISAFVLTAKKYGLPIPEALEEIALNIHDAIPMACLMARKVAEEKFEKVFQGRELDWKAKAHRAADYQCERCKSKKRKPNCDACYLARVMQEIEVWEELAPAQENQA